jgi:DtxR family manganese transport transcriptional regulator
MHTIVSYATIVAYDRLHESIQEWGSDSTMGVVPNRIRRRKGSGVAPSEFASENVSSEPHQKARIARAEELAEDYVEVIDDLITATGEARVVDIAERLGVTHVTVTRTVARLQKQGLVRSEKYRSVFLSESGKRLALRVRRRHALVLSFLRALGIDEETARIDAEGIEHHVSERTLRAFRKFCDMSLTRAQRDHLGLAKRVV